jgi:glutamate carboxypeptidase
MHRPRTGSPTTVHEIAATPPFEGLTLDLHGGMTRAPKPMDASQTALFEAVRETGALLGQTIAWNPVGRGLRRQ